MKTTSFIILFSILALSLLSAQNKAFPWPEGKKMALSLTWDDARSSQPSVGIPLLNEYDVNATFYVLPEAVREQLQGWKSAVTNGHEIANHSYHHPCRGNFRWTRDQALNDYTIDRMKKELETANNELGNLLGVTPVSYAYPCGQMEIGEGATTQTFVPLIDELFLSGRGWMDEASVDPWYCDMARLTGVSMDNQEFEEILPMIEDAAEAGDWLVLAGHEMDTAGTQTTYLRTIRQLCEYALDPDNGVWIAPVGEIARYVTEQRRLMADTVNIPRISRPNEEGVINLTAERGRGIGPRIEYMPEWQAFGWFWAKDRIEWDMDVHRDGLYDVSMEWSVDDEEAGKEFILEVRDEQIFGQVPTTGSWETFEAMKIGRILLKKGYNKLIFRPATDFGEGALLDLRKLVLKPAKGR